MKQQFKIIRFWIVANVNQLFYSLFYFLFRSANFKDFNLKT